MPSRWVTYQRERFPLAAHGPLIAAFSFSAVCYSSLARGDVQIPEPEVALVAFASALVFFLQLRIADEFKDFEEDSRFRPYRPVPRGLVSLRELGMLGAGCAALQLVLALWLAPFLALILLVVWVYLALMSHEFFVRDWLKAHPVVYMWSHMLIMPLIDFYATACDWVTAGTGLPWGLFWFLCVSFANGIVIEIGRKLRAPADEEEGVETYSVLWGPRRAALVWLGAVCATAVLAAAAAARVDFLVPVAVLLAILIAAATFVVRGFIRAPVAGAGKRIELVSGVWTLLMYLSLGAAPLLWRAL